MNLQSSVSDPRQSGYVGALRHRPQLWRTLVAVLAGLLVLLVVLGSLAIPVGIAVDTLIGVTPFDPANPSLTTGFWAAGNLLIALLIPVTMLVQKVVYGASPGTLSSLEGRFRWSVLMRASVLVLPVWVVYTLIMRPLLGTGAPVWSGLNLVLCLVAIATIPLQSAGEEYLFRGLIFRAIGARFPRPLLAFTIATAVSALQFGLIHGATDPWGVAYYIAMGISFAVLTERTGGLEVPILIHALNNTLVLLPVIIAGELASVSSASGPIVFIPIILITVVTLVLWKMTPWLTRRAPKGTEAAV